MIQTTNAIEKSKMLLTGREAARMLSISERTLWGLTAAGEVRCVRIGRRLVRYDPADLREWIETRKAAPVAASGQ